MDRNRTRTEASRASLKDALASALGDAAPSEAVARALVDGFLREIGVTTDRSRGWAPVASAVRYALEHDALMPMRVLSEGLERSAGGGFKSYAPEVLSALRKGLDETYQHIVEGDYRTWRYENPVGREQLAMLSDAEQRVWRESGSVEEKVGDERTVATREVDDVDALWVTKICSASHAFDSFARQCLVPLLANARTKAIVVDDPEHPDAPIARAYLRVFDVVGIGPVVYLDPIMRESGDSSAIERAIVRHAAEKAAKMGVPLALAHGTGRHMFEDAQKVDLELKLSASNAGIEASDTIDGATGYHDWDNRTAQRAAARRIILVDPKSIR
jgi:hypothetical protein